jgi:non-ribosomal peptide synthetase component E (peptide arylation enzyme)
MDFCKQHMADYALPHRIVFVDEFPHTKMGKVDFVKLENRINGRN